jgi:hypothetical protein
MSFQLAVFPKKQKKLTTDLSRDFLKTAKGNNADSS